MKILALVKSSVDSGQRLYAEHFSSPGMGSIVNDKDGNSWKAEPVH